MPPSASSRPYRSTKRNRPCDRCRETKTRCQILTGPSCTKCQKEGLDCNASNKGHPTPRSGASQRSGDPSLTPTSTANHALPSQGWTQSPPACPASMAATGIEPESIEAPVSLRPTPLLQEQEADVRISTQFSQTIEGLEGASAQVFGSSSECDPWLLRHCKFDDFGAISFQHTQFRNAGGVPLTDKIPVHFLVEPDEMHESAKQETRVLNKQIASREELSRIVPVECGQRLVAL